MLSHLFPKAALVCLLSTATLSPLVSRAQSKEAKLPVDSKVTIGKLPNGLTYYIRPNNKPEKKVELRLVVNAGSILENDDQQGLAHFMEHMNFNGTKNFPEIKLVDFLQSIGVEFGADLNAYTSFDETVYILPIPTDKPGNLESGFQVIEDWAHNANLTDKDIDDERAVVLEESRMGKGAQDRMMKKYLPKVLAGSQYANRLPIGKDEILKTFKYETIRSFYRDWYRPDLMAVMVVGDVTVPQAKALIEKHFSGIKNPAKPRERKAFEVKPYTDASAMVVTDKEATNYMFQMVFSARKEDKEVTVNDYRSKMVRSIFNSLLNRRLQELTQVATPPFIFAGAGAEGGYARGYENFNLIAIASSDIETAVNAAVGELVKAQEHGFTGSELEIVKKQMLNGMEKAYNERNTTESGQIVDEYVRNFLTQEPIPGIEQEYKYAQQMLPGITLEEVNAEAKKWLAKENSSEYFALVTGPDNKQMKVPTDMELKTMVGNALNQKVTANAEKKVVDNLLEKEPVAGKIVSEAVDKELNATTYTLSNGVKVTVKATDFKTDEIIMSAVKQGGDNNYGPEDKANAKFMTDIIESMGYGQFTPTQLTDALSGKTIGLLPRMTDVSAKLDGNSSVKDFESLMQLTHLQLTEPRRDEALFNGFTGKMKMQLQFMGSNPQYAFIDTLGKALYNNDPRRPIMVPTAADMDKIKMDRVLEIYKNEFSNADGFHFFIVGNISEGTLKPLLEKYIASLPVKGTKPSFKDNGLRTVKGNTKFEFKKGQEQKSLVLSIYSGEMPYSEELALQTDMIGEILSIKVIEQIREQMGAIYGGGFGGEFERDPYPHYSLSGQFPCGPENVDPILKKAAEEIEEIKTHGPSVKDLDKVKLAKLEKRRESIKTNGYWAAKLEQLMFWNYSKQRFLNGEAEVNKITVADIKATANKLFDGKNSFIAILNPEVIETKKAEKTQGTGK
jgi:zinc protease